MAEGLIPRGLHPAFLEPLRVHDRDSRDRLLLSNRPHDEYPRCVRLTAASTRRSENDLVLHRPILRLAFADESRVSRRPTRFDDFLRSPWALSSPRGHSEEKPPLTPLSPHLIWIVRSPDDDLLARPKITTCSAPRERWQSVCDRRAPSLDRTNAPLHLSVPERRPRDLAGFAAWIRVSFVGSRVTSWVTR